MDPNAVFIIRKLQEQNDKLLQVIRSQNNEIELLKKDIYLINSLKTRMENLNVK